MRELFICTTDREEILIREVYTYTEQNIGHSEPDIWFVHLLDRDDHFICVLTEHIGRLKDQRTIRIVLREHPMTVRVGGDIEQCRVHIDKMESETTKVSISPARCESHCEVDCIVSTAQCFTDNTVVFQTDGGVSGIHKFGGPVGLE